MNDLVEVGVFPEGDGAPLYLQRHRIVSGRQTITVVVPRRPASAGIGPLNKLIQRATGDNVVAVDKDQRRNASAAEETGHGLDNVCDNRHVTT